MLASSPGLSPPLHELYMYRQLGGGGGGGGVGEATNCNDTCSAKILSSSPIHTHTCQPRHHASFSPSSSPTQVLHKLDVTLQPGDALVWFPGWEHETRILIGPSISLSLHFTSPADSTYQNTFSEVLRERVSPNCKWKIANPT